MSNGKFSNHGELGQNLSERLYVKIVVHINQYLSTCTQYQRLDSFEHAAEKAIIFDLR